MDRRERMLGGLALDKPGLEIGASYSPLAPKREGYPVKIIDYMDQAGLVEKYSKHNVDVSLIEPVDFVWSGQRYADLVQGERFEWVLASHVIEHSTDLIGFIKDLEAVMTDTGILSLAVPDKRLCFDYYRSTSDLARVIDTHQLGADWPTPGAATEHFLNASSRNGAIIWAGNGPDDPTFIHDVDYTAGAVEDITTRRLYHDVHSWTFTPASFRLLVNDLYDLGYIKLREIAPAAPGPGEFYVKMSMSGPGPQQSRLDLARQAALER